MSRGIAITGWGAALPDRVVTNAELAPRVGTTDEWIVERTGIRARHMGGSTAGLASAAGLAAIDRAGLTPDDIDMVVLATLTPDQALPATAYAVTHSMGLRCGAFDLNAACSGWVYSLVTAAGLVATGVDRVLVIGAETLTKRVVNPDDRNTAILFGDGAGATMVEAVPGEGGLLGFDIGSDGSLGWTLQAEFGAYATMDGKEIYKRAVRATVESAQSALEKAKVDIADIALFVPHQANLRIIEGVAQRLGVSMDMTSIVLDRTGNTSAASIPLALADAADAGRLHDGDLVLFAGFGAGMAWASAVVRWGR